jgi:hypothetical protein
MLCVVFLPLFRALIAAWGGPHEGTRTVVAFEAVRVLRL